jgi:hypothetical protein
MARTDAGICESCSCRDRRQHRPWCSGPSVLGVGAGTLADLAGSDAAGNAYAQAYAAIEIFILWGLLAVIAIIAGVKSAMA